MTQPNLLVLMPDQMRADCLSCAGHLDSRTPRLDRLAAEGVRFTNAFTTNPLCMPARASFLTGRFSSEHGIWRNAGRLPKKTPTLLSALREAGYRTIHVGKSHYYPHEDAVHLERRRNKGYMRSLGLDVVREVTGPKAASWCGSLLTDHWKRRGLLQTYRDDFARRKKAGPLQATWPSPLPEGEGLDDFVAALAAKEIGRANARRPFFAFVGFGGPHDPWDPPRGWAARFDPDRVARPLPPAEPGAHVPADASAFQRHVQSGLPATPEQLARIRALYYAKVAHVDACIGTVLDALERHGLAERTAVLVWADHGEMLGDRGRLGKRVMYGPAVRVPLLLRLPDREHAGSVVDTPVSVVDALPTLLELAGAPPGMAGSLSHGRSLLDLVARPDAPHHVAVFAEMHGDNGFDASPDGPAFQYQELVFDGRFQLVRASNGTPLHLYDVATDPGEADNLLGHAEAATVTERLCGLLDDWRGRLRTTS